MVSMQQAPPTNTGPQVPPAEKQAMEDVAKEYYNVKPYEPGWLNKSEADVSITTVEAFSGDAATVMVTLDWSKTGHDDSAVYVLDMQKKDGVWTIVKETESLPD